MPVIFSVPHATRKLKELIESLSIETDECQEWPFSRNNRNYGIVFFEGGMKLVHRVAQKLTDPAFDESLCSLHKCDNRPCFNPRHLFQGTRGDNNRDMRAKGRNRAGFQFTPIHKTGESNNLAKLKTSDVIRIRELNASGVSRASIATEFGITQTNLSFIVNRKTWKHIL